jgi:hypothetical protein
MKNAEEKIPCAVMEIFGTPLFRKDFCQLVVTLLIRLLPWPAYR